MEKNHKCVVCGSANDVGLYGKPGQPGPEVHVCLDCYSDVSSHKFMEYLSSIGLDSPLGVVTLTTFEWCASCDMEVEIALDFTKRQPCPACGDMILPCGACCPIFRNESLPGMGCSECPFPDESAKF